MRTYNNCMAISSTNSNLVMRRWHAWEVTSLSKSALNLSVSRIVRNCATSARSSATWWHV